MTSSADLKTRVLAAARATPSPTRNRARSMRLLALAGAAAIALGLFEALGGVRVQGRPTALIVGTAGGWAALAIAAAWGLLGRGRSMLGRPRVILVAVALATPLLLFAWKVLWTTRFGAEMMAPMEGRIGLRCLRLDLLTGIFPFLALLLWRRGTDPLHPRLTGAVVGVASGALAGILVDLWCPLADPPHLIVGHVLPMAILAGLGALLGRRLLGLPRT